MRVLLIFPPWFNPTQPYLGLFELRAVLRSYTMWEVDIYDWAIESYRSLLTSDTLDEVARQKGIHAPSHISSSLENICTQLALPNETYRTAVRAIDEVFNWYSTAFPSLKLLRYCGVETVGWSLNSSAELISFAEQNNNNIFGFLYQRLVEPRLREVGYKTIGISLVCPDQLPAVATLAVQLRMRRPDIRLVLGGPLATMIANEWPRPAILDFFDDVYIGAANKDVVFAFSGKNEGNSNCQKAAPIWPAAIWEGVDINRYLAPAPVLPLRASAGCSWQCRFCSSPSVAEKLEGRRFRFRGGIPIAEEIEAHIEAGRANHFFLVGEMLTWSNARAVAQSLRERSLRCDIGWYFWGRVAPRPPDGLLDLLAEAGCRRICFGLETLDPKALRFTNKGYAPEEAEKTLKTVVSAGIQPHLFLMTGLSENDHDESDSRIEALVSSLVNIGARGLTVTISPFEPQKWSPWGKDYYRNTPLEFQSNLSCCDLQISQLPSAIAIAHASKLHKKISRCLTNGPYLGDFGNVHQLIFFESQSERENVRGG